MKTHWVASAIICSLVVLFCSVYSSVPGIAEDALAKEKSDEFDGKFVTVYVSDPLEETGYVLTDVELIHLGGRYMLVGTGADTGHEEDWTAGMHVGVAWDSVTVYYAMTEEQFKEKLQQYQ